MSGAELSTVFKVLGAIAKPATDKLKRKEGVVAVLHTLGMAPDAPPPDFAGVYTYTVVEYCYGKPEPVLRLFQNQYVREAFERSFATGDPTHLDREVTEILQWNEETGALGRLDYNLAREVTGFSIFRRPRSRPSSWPSARATTSATSRAAPCRSTPSTTTTCGCSALAAWP
jgi:hypothetical protein